MKKAFFLTISFVLLSINSPAQDYCESSSQSCELYSCLEEEFQCGKKSYLQAYGGKNCQKFLKDQETTSEALQAWYPKVRLCLQERLIEIVTALHGEEKFCKSMEKAAFQSHVQCYLETGFCELSKIDQLRVAKVAGKDLFHPQSIKAEIEVSRACTAHRD